MGYRITIAYRSSDPYDMGWGSPSEAAIYNLADLATPLGRLTYNANGTITDLGGRVYACTGCSNALGTDLETADGTMQLPGDSGPSLQVARVASGQPLVGSVVRDGVSYNYAYTYNGGAPFYQVQTNSYLYTQLAVTGPSGFNQVYQLVQTGTTNQKRNVIAGVTDSISRVSSFQFDLAYRPVQVTYPEGNAVRALYDDRGNIVERRAYARPGTGLADIVETAAYPDAPGGMPNLCTIMCWCRAKRKCRPIYAERVGRNIYTVADDHDGRRTLHARAGHPYR